MPDILIRDIDEQLDKALKYRAIEHGHTREAEIKAILRTAINKHPNKRTLAEALLAIPKINTDEDLFERSSDK